MHSAFGGIVERVNPFPTPVKNMALLYRPVTYMGYSFFSISNRFFSVSDMM